MPALIGTVVGKAVSLLEPIGKIIAGVLAIVVFLSFLLNFLPSDPIAPLLNSFISEISAYYTLINLIVPVKLISSLLLYRSAWFVYFSVPRALYSAFSAHGNSIFRHVGV